MSICTHEFRVGASGVLNSSVVPSSRQDSIRSGYMSDHEALAATSSSRPLQPTAKAQQVSIDSATGSDARLCYLTSSEVSFLCPIATAPSVQCSGEKKTACESLSEGKWWPWQKFWNAIFLVWQLADIEPVRRETHTYIHEKSLVPISYSVVYVQRDFLSFFRSMRQIFPREKHFLLLGVPNVGFI